MTILALRNWSEPMLLVFTATWLVMFVLFLWAMLKMERSLNHEGQSLFYPWRVPSSRKEARHIDGVLSTSIRRLRSGEDEVEVLASLRLHVEGKLPREADRHYRRAVEGLRDAAVASRGPSQSKNRLRPSSWSSNRVTSDAGKSLVRPEGY